MERKLRQLFDFVVPLESQAKPFQRFLSFTSSGTLETLEHTPERWNTSEGILTQFNYAMLARLYMEL